MHPPPSPPLHAGSISQHHSLAPKTAHIVDQPRGWEDRSSSANGSTVAISTITTTTASSSTNSSNVSAALAAAASASYGFDGISSLHDGGGGTGTGNNNGGAAVVVTRSSNFATININNDISVSSSGVSRSNGSGGVGRLLSGGRRSDSLGGANGVDRDFHRIMKAGVVVFKHSCELFSLLAVITTTIFFCWSAIFKPGAFPFGSYALRRSFQRWLPP